MSQDVIFSITKLHFPPTRTDEYGYPQPQNPYQITFSSLFGLHKPQNPYFSRQFSPNRKCRAFFGENLGLFCLPKPKTSFSEDLMAYISQELPIKSFLSFLSFASFLSFPTSHEIGVDGVLLSFKSFLSFTSFLLICGTAPAKCGKCSRIRLQ